MTQPGKQETGQGGTTAVCWHTDVEMLRASLLADDEIAVIVSMVTEGRCPVCPTGDAIYGEYVRRIEAGRGRP